MILSRKLLILSVLLIALLLRGWGAIEQPPLSDDVLAAYTAFNYTEAGQFGPTMPFHPNLRNILLSYTQNWFGSGVLAIRGISFMLGTLSVVLLYLIVVALGGSDKVAWLAAFLLALDPVHIVFSRQAIQEVHTTFFFLAGVLFFIVSLGEQSLMNNTVKREISYSNRLSPLCLVLSGIMFGLGAASKSHALFPLLACFVYGVYISIMKMRGSGRLVKLSLVISTLCLLPFTVYLLTYTPWFSRGYGLYDWIVMQKMLFLDMTAFAGSPIDSMKDTVAILWFFKPMMGYGIFSESPSGIHVTIAMGNPFAWMAVMPATGYLLFKLRKVRQWKARNISIAFLALFAVSYFPLAFTTRPIWVLSSIAVTPFAFAIVAVAAVEVSDKWGRGLLRAYVIAVLAVTLLMYPMATGNALKYKYLHVVTEQFNPH